MHFVTGGKAGSLQREEPPRTRIVVAVAAALLVLAAWPVAAADAELAITAPVADSYTNNTEPTFAGAVFPIAEQVEFCKIEVSLYAGTSVTGAPLGPPLEALGCSWLTQPAARLEQGVYTAVASGEREGEPVPESAPVTFTVDTTPPSPVIGSPSGAAVTASTSISVSGTSTSAAGDLPTVTVQVLTAASPEGPPFEAIELPVSDGSWAGTIAGLGPGRYTLRAQQADAAGNIGASTPVALTVVAPSPPAASFSWFPSSPQVGEPVSVVSSSTDAESPLTGFAWALGGTTPFSAGKPTFTTSFATPGAHVVRLKVTDAAGRASEATQTIAVRHHRATLIQPFPIVRIAGRETRRGARLTLLTVTAPVSSLVTVKVSGGGRRASSESRLATVRKPNASSTVVMSFPHFARPISAGAVLEVRVTKAGEIGKLTRFIPHAGRLPTRQDTCLSASGKPTRCPSA
jgi:hypothetical protein